MHMGELRYSGQRMAITPAADRKAWTRTRILLTLLYPLSYIPVSGQTAVRCCGSFVMRGISHVPPAATKVNQLPGFEARQLPRRIPYEW